VDLIRSIDVVINYCVPSNETDPIFTYDFTDSFNVKTIIFCRILEPPASKIGQNSSSSLIKIIINYCVVTSRCVFVNKVLKYPNISQTQFILHTYLPMKMEQIECSETSA
jgi:hypothetical protein